MENKIEIGIDKLKQNVVVSDVKVSYVQEADTNSHDLQQLDIITEDSGGGIYYVIKTDRWAFDDLGELIKVIEDFKNRL